jgi:hypothetical protein
MAAYLACGSGALVSHRAAAALRGLAGFPEDSIELSVAGQRGRRLGFVVHRTAPLPRVDVTVVNGMPATSVARTLIDLASVVPDDLLEEALDDALRRKLVSLPRLRWRIAELAGKGRPGIALIRSLVEARGGGDAVPGSVFETRLLRLLMKGGLPMPALQHEIRSGRRLIAIVDFAFPEARLAVEADGYRCHSGRARWEHDLARRNALTSMGWRVLHVTWNDLTRRGSATLEGIEAALARVTGSPPGELAAGPPRGVTNLRGVP